MNPRPRTTGAGPTPDAVRRARATLYGPDHAPTAAYRSYLRHRRDHDELVDRRNRALASARRNPMALQNWPVEGRAHAELIDAALDRWLATGHKADVESALAVLAEDQRTRDHDTPRDDTPHDDTPHDDGTAPVHRPGPSGS